MRQYIVKWREEKKSSAAMQTFQRQPSRHKKINIDTIGLEEFENISVAHIEVRDLYVELMIKRLWVEFLDQTMSSWAKYLKHYHIIDTKETL